MPEKITEVFRTQRAKRQCQNHPLGTPGSLVYNLTTFIQCVCVWGGEGGGSPSQKIKPLVAQVLPPPT